MTHATRGSYRREIYVARLVGQRLRKPGVIVDIAPEATRQEGGAGAVGVDVGGGGGGVGRLESVVGDGVVDLGRHVEIGGGGGKG